MSAGPDSGFEISVATPGNWLRIDPDQLGEEGALGSLVDERLNDIPELAEHRDQVLGTAASTLESARENGVLFCAILADLTDTDQPLIATLSVLATPSPPIDPDQDEITRISAIRDELDDQEPDVVQRVVDSMLLPGGPAMRVARMIDLPLTGEGESRISLTVLSVQYFFAVPGADGFVVLNFSTPTVGAHLRLQAIFHDIAAEFRFFDGDGDELIAVEGDGTPDFDLEGNGNADGNGDGR